MSPAAMLNQERYTEGELVRCTGYRLGARCTKHVCAVPLNTIATARSISSNSEAKAGTVSYQCKHCKALTEVRAEPVGVAA